MAFGASVGGGYTIHHRPDIPPREPLQAAKSSRHATECRNFLDSVIRYNTTKRTELERAWNRARMYDRAKQWLQPLRGHGSSRLWFAWEPIRVTSKTDLFPRPVRNVFSAAMQDETARLVGVGRKPYVRVDDQELEEAGLLGKRALTSRLEEENWIKIQRLGGYHMSMFGQWIQSSEWEIDLLKTLKVPAEAVGCPDCPDQQYASAQIPGAVAFQMPPGAVQVDGEAQGDDRYTLTNCPSCGQGMVPFKVTPEIMGATDKLGRPMHYAVPLGEDRVRVRSPYAFFPQNQGIGYETDDEMEEWAFREPISIHALRRRFLNGDLVEPARDWEVFRHHPVIVGYWGLSYGSEGTWDHHTMLDTYYLKPNREFPRGRFIAMAGTVLLDDGDYFLDGTEIPRCECRVSQWELSEGEIWGKSLAEDMHPIQDNINSTLSQAMDIRHKYTSPKIIIGAGMQLNFAGEVNDVYQGDVWRLDTRGIPPELAAKYPMFFGGEGRVGSIWEEQDRDKEMIAVVSGAHDAELGNVSGVELNYSALLFAAQKSATRRQPRIDGMRLLIRGTFAHKLRLICHLWKTERLVRYRDDENEWQVTKLKGADLKGQWDVQLEDEPIVDSAIAKRASIQQGIDWGTIRRSVEGGSFATDRRINREIGVPPELNEDRNNQYDHSIREWDYFLNAGDEPAVDEIGDLHELHYATHNDQLLSRDARKLKDVIGSMGVPWSRVLLLTAEWRRLLSDLQQQRMLLVNAPTPEKMAELGAPPGQIAQAQAKLDIVAQRLQGFPAPLELQIYHVWLRLLTASLSASDPEIMETLLPLRPTDGPERSPLKRLVRFNAHRLAHFMLRLNTAAASTIMTPGSLGAPPPMPVEPGAPGPAPGGGSPAAPGAPSVEMLQQAGQQPVMPGMG